ncbi:Transketolase C-terminal/Pyruvate-ferredoxin oxidoreductase domain II [Penicillium verhagenii]|uniref:Transketolase C-terminal/Pyruvate-ferredoxin oxidoreductase domain II n=1 Tax=Penicillium verhagenii TaxID=1562060 RepID=UPI0025454204|nr:Transketolase C-terminal/Pyruvate-ferredoxin oxidoreductase domain II [Penicillium verhagenii]KAJ5928777.1 Transketolase C-terminal/Pyruvate-ferredoxin oxidoreductase domain II [Penicillium verhagenii]
MGATNPALSALSGPTYVTAQTLIQQVAYLLSDKIFSYSPETFDLDTALQQWSAAQETNASGESPVVKTLETRQGAGNMALGYLFSQDFDLKKRHVPQGIVASSATLPYMRSALEQLSLLYSVASPVAAHVAAADYAGEDGLVSDYASALSLAEDLGLGLVSSASAHESQHMALFATLLASVLPSIHIYDGVRVGRETTRVIDVLDKDGLARTYETVRKTLDDSRTRHLDAQGKVLDLLKTLNGELGTDYSAFEYHGHSEATSVLVVFGTVEATLAAQVARSVAKSGVKIGVVNVRVYRPFIEEEFLRVLPQSVKTVGVLGQVADEQAVQEESVHSALYEDVLAALTFAAGREHAPSCVEVKYPRSQTWNQITTAAAFQCIYDQPILSANSVTDEAAPLQLLDPTTVQEYTFWDVDNSVSESATQTLSQALAADSASNVTTSKIHDNLVQGGAIRVDIRKSAKIVDAPYAVTAADVSYVGNLALLNDVDVLASVKDNAKIIVNAPGVKDEDLEKKLPALFRQTVVQRGISLFVIDASAIEGASLDALTLQAAFIRVALPSQEGVATKKLASIVGNAEAVEKVSTDLDKVLRQIETPEAWKEPEGVTEVPELLKDISANSFVSFDKEEAEASTLLRDWQTAAKGLAFKEAFGTRNALRPDLATKTFTVHVKENRRLTPVTYDRNIFHIEFDLGNTGLTYDIGEALGVHAENDPKEVMDFIAFYGLNPDSIVEVPSREDPNVFENRTVYQALVQNVDIFGRPPKRFYEALAEFASDEKEKTDLKTLGGPDGATEFKRRAEVDTVTFADILLEYPSAHPDFHEIVRIVGPLKRREYSIASCQKVTPDSVALMIVAVNWASPNGKDRFGLATRYLSSLQVGSPITVSVKSSVMKLPPKSTQPLIMAGLGTGLAPFRAFVQHRALEKAQGKEIGAVLLYMGSRHQREEYCYGEEWEAYQEAGVITLLGAAFSRDQPQKIYIQDRMRESLAEIRKAYIQEDGAFYLCGPTWPVPDVTAVLEEAIGAEAKANGKKVDTRKEIEKLKDEERYVLEVY